MNKYYERIIEDEIKRKLEYTGGVLIVGPKWCGKSTTALKISKSSVLMQDKVKFEQNYLLAKSNPSLFLKGDTPKLIDEWQTIPFIRDSIRYEIDLRQKFNQFILTGSVLPYANGVNDFFHSGTGRIAPVLMRPMSLYESKESNGEVSLQDLFEHKEFKGGESSLNLLDYAYLICRGGWPVSLQIEDKINAIRSTKQYYEGIINFDLPRMDNPKLNKNKVEKLLKSYSRNIGTCATYITLRDDVKEFNNENIHEDTIKTYVESLKRLFFIEDVPAFSINLRSKTNIRTSDTRYFIDPSIPTSALNITPNNMVNDIRFFGFLFENLCLRDLRVYVDSLGGKVFHYRDADNLEVDFIVNLDNGERGAIEVKLGEAFIEEGAKNLIKFKNKINDKVVKLPTFLMVLTATQYAYKRDDGVIVCPLGCLKN